MNSSNERKYYEYLENIIRERKQKGVFFPIGSRDYEMDLSLLLDHIQRKNPNLAQKLLDNFIDIEEIPALKNASNEEIKNFLRKTPKGTIAHLKNNKGENLYIFNNGKSHKLQVINSKIKKIDLETLKKSVLANILKKDLKQVYEKIHKQENKKKINAISVFNKSSSLVKEVNPVGKNKFENDFIEMSQKWGSTASPMALLGAYILPMNNIERKELFGMFTQKGINTTDKLCKHLNELVDKAHSKKQIVEHKFQREKHKSLSLRGR